MESEPGTAHSPCVALDALEGSGERAGEQLWYARVHSHGN